MFTGTLTNVVTVLAGTAIGAVAGAHLPARLQETLVATLGLLTAALAVREIIAVEDFILVLAAVLLGALTGELLRIEQGLQRLGDALQRRWSKGGGASFSEGFVLASLLFCVGPLTVLGAIEDGLGDPELLLVKAALDGVAAIAFAAIYGWGVALSAATVLIVQGGIAVGAGGLDGVLTDDLLAALGAAGGVLLLGIALRLLDLKHIRVANLLPALVFAPVLVSAFG